MHITLHAPSTTKGTLAVAGVLGIAHHMWLRFTLPMLPMTSVKWGATFLPPRGWRMRDSRVQDHAPH